MRESNERDDIKSNGIANPCFPCSEMCKNTNDAADVDFSFAALTGDYSVNTNRWTEIDTQPRITQGPKGASVTH